MAGCRAEVLPASREAMKATEVFVPVTVWTEVRASVTQKSPVLRGAWGISLWLSG